MKKQIIRNGTRLEYLSAVGIIDELLIEFPNLERKDLLSYLKNSTILYSR